LQKPDDFPAEKPIHPGRVLLKGLLIFAIINLLFALVKPSLGWFVLFNRGPIPGFERFPQLWTPMLLKDGSVSFERELLSDTDVLFGSHIVSSHSKSVDEYRVFIYGDSSVWGTALTSDQTLAGQLNALRLQTCAGQRVVVYNLGYPSNSATKDLIIMEQAQRYQPDLNVWLFSLLAFAPARQYAQFMADNPVAVMGLNSDYMLGLDMTQFPAIRKSFWDETLVGRRHDLSLLLRWNASALLTAMLGTDEPRIPVNDQTMMTDQPKSDLDYYGLTPPADLQASLSLQTLGVSYKIAQGKIIYVSEPIVISTGPHSDISYNSIFPRWAYDQYRLIMNALSVENGWSYLDLWNLVPQNEFSTSIFHLTPAGETRLAQEVAKLVLGVACR